MTDEMRQIKRAQDHFRWMQNWAKTKHSDEECKQLKWFFEGEEYAFKMVADYLGTMLHAIEEPADRAA
jgi:hypothetical protein